MVTCYEQNVKLFRACQQRGHCLSHQLTLNLKSPCRYGPGIIKRFFRKSLTETGEGSGERGAGRGGGIGWLDGERWRRGDGRSGERSVATGLSASLGNLTIRWQKEEFAICLQSLRL